MHACLCMTNETPALACSLLETTREHGSRALKCRNDQVRAHALSHASPRSGTPDGTAKAVIAFLGISHEKRGVEPAMLHSRPTGSSDEPTAHFESLTASEACRYHINVINCISPPDVQHMLPIVPWVSADRITHRPRITMRSIMLEWHSVERAHSCCIAFAWMFPCCMLAMLSMDPMVLIWRTRADS
ncbi:uncharacterized protein BO95DRAFT_41785 [Aspergillus brunneoviolaceus CBS 621.78]|uniref:Uncharacterized protein n=1 Tax=Aspergillus brunneoviolaceus CBS 621.78 TaxID=1450534 RepID=A0ACD1FRW1_9EURO|nr:hypothetical protein BO95DRAFT_41785 [Aspergillus brunneoviolaceus CBS 621.78]RAH39710.1 hypothetical protein BO95DRAFT_41785 [Aspergillus brunneoviolaceus CBS 621.78]